MVVLRKKKQTDYNHTTNINTKGVTNINLVTIFLVGFIYISN